MAEVLGPNPNASKETASVYPPPAIYLFRVFAALSYPRAFALWNALLLLASALLLRLTSADPAVWLLLLTWPGLHLELGLCKPVPSPDLGVLDGTAPDPEEPPVVGRRIAGCFVPPGRSGSGSRSCTSSREGIGAALPGADRGRRRILFAAAPASAGSPNGRRAPRFIRTISSASTTKDLFKVALYKSMRGLFAISARWFMIARYATSLALGTGGLALRRQEGRGNRPDSFSASFFWRSPTHTVLEQHLGRSRCFFLWSSRGLNLASAGRGPGAVAAGLIFNAALFFILGGFRARRTASPPRRKSPRLPDLRAGRAFCARVVDAPGKLRASSPAVTGRSLNFRRRSAYFIPHPAAIWENAPSRPRP